MKELLSVGYIKKSEDKVLNVTKERIKSYIDNFDRAIDVICKLPYYLIGNLESVKTDIGQIQSWSYENYVQIPYTFYSIHRMMERGYYLEANIIIRNVLEVFIQMKYLNKYPHKFEGHITRKKKVAFRVMFDEFSEGFYEKYYGGLLSGFAHGGISKSLFRFEGQAGNNRRTIMGNEFNVDFLSMAMNYVVALLMGFLNYTEIIFPRNNIKSNEQLKEAIEKTKKWGQDYMKRHKESKRQSMNWYKHIDSFICEK